LVRRSRALRPAAAAAIVAGLLAFEACRRSVQAEPRSPEPTRAPAPTASPVPTPAPSPAAVPVDPERLKAAIAEVEEPRGKRVRLKIAPELRMYEDNRRFLAIQMAESRERDYMLPADEAELAGLVLKGELVELPAMTDDYVLYDLGTAVEEDPLSHWDVSSETNVPLLPSLAARDAERTRLEKLVRKGGRAGREARRTLPNLAQYDDQALRERLSAEYADLERLAKNWGGETYDLSKNEDRARFQVRLMSCLRPQAATLLQRIAAAYHAKFHRKLPVSSLTRTQRYQRQLRRVNRNATNVEFPPHTTGMAFDISYRFMPAEEQNFLLAEIARIKVEGKIEALREPRNSIHVFVFQHGRPPEDAVQAFMELMDETRARPKTPHRRRRT
jgi:hypothetical protein